MTATIVTEGLARWYGRVIGLIEADLTFEPGVTGLLGPNGAGKTTLLNLVTGQIRPSLGTVKVLDRHAWNSPSLYRRIGYCPEGDRFYWKMTGHQFVTEMACLHGFSRHDARTRAHRVLDELGMGDSLGRPLQTYSKGMRQRTKLAQAIVHDPDVVILDEPLTGTDPQGRRLLIDNIQAQGEAGKTVLVSSHILHEVESMTRRVVVVHQGRIRAAGTVDEIRGLLDDFPVRIRISGTALRSLARELLALPDVVGVDLQRNETVLEIQTRHAAPLYRVLPDLISRLEVEVDEITGEDSSLEAVFDLLMAGVSARLRGTLR